MTTDELKAHITDLEDARPDSEIEVRLERRGTSPAMTLTFYDATHEETIGVLMQGYGLRFKTAIR